MDAINKVYVNGTEYSIGGGGGEVQELNYTYAPNIYKTYQFYNVDSSQQYALGIDFEKLAQHIRNIGFDLELMIENGQANISLGFLTTASYGTYSPFDVTAMYKITYANGSLSVYFYTDNATSYTIFDGYVVSECQTLGDVIDRLEGIGQYLPDVEGFNYCLTPVNYIFDRDFINTLADFQHTLISNVGAVGSGSSIEIKPINMTETFKEVLYPIYNPSE